MFAFLYFRFILRNYIAQNAIAAAEEGDFSEVQRVLKLLENPYSDEVDLKYIDRMKADESEATFDDAGIAFNRHSQTPQLLTILVLNFEKSHFIPVDVSIRHINRYKMAFFIF